MFSMIPNTIEPPGAITPVPSEKLPPQTPVRFPQCTPRTDAKTSSSPDQSGKPLVSHLQAIYRPTDIKLTHFEALGIHVISDSKPEDLIPEPGYLPPVEAWIAIDSDSLPEANDATKRPLSNGNLSPGVQTYRERQNELSLDNTAAFRSIRRLPPPAGETAVRLGNAYEFFKNLDFFSAFWDDTSLPRDVGVPEVPSSDEPLESSEGSEGTKDNVLSANDPSPTPIPSHLLTHQRTGTGSQLPPEYRQNLLTAFVKLVAYDFGCNVSHARSEPRLHLTPRPSPHGHSKPPSSFNSSAQFIYRTPTDRASARGGVLEGPVATISCRTVTVFATESDSLLDLAREVVAVLLTAQHRSRLNKTENRFGEHQWWTTKPRWGGGPGGPIGKEAEKSDDPSPVPHHHSSIQEKISHPTTVVHAVESALHRGVAAETKRIFGINGAGPSKRSKKVKENGHMQIYEYYRKMLPPSATWDRRTRYMPIGQPTPSSGYDDIFLISALNHHVSIIRVRVPETLLKVLDGEDGGWERVVMWRSRWYDFFIVEDRVEAMQIIWGMMAYQMRKIEGSTPEEKKEETVGAEKMDTT